MGHLVDYHILVHIQNYNFYTNWSLMCLLTWLLTFTELSFAFIFLHLIVLALNELSTYLHKLNIIFLKVDYRIFFSIFREVYILFKLKQKLCFIKIFLIYIINDRSVNYDCLFIKFSEIDKMFNFKWRMGFHEPFDMKIWAFMNFRGSSCAFIKVFAHLFFICFSCFSNNFFSSIQNFGH